AYLPSGENTASTGAPWVTPARSGTPNSARSTSSTTVSVSSRLSASYSVEVWPYIMLLAMTVPVGLATTDFGVISPVIRSRWTRRVVFEGSAGGGSGAEPAEGPLRSGPTALVARPAIMPPAITSERIAMANVE